MSKDHPHLATSYNNLSQIYKALGRLDQAENFARRAVKILETLFPNGHPNLDIMRNNLERIRGKRAK